MSDDTPQGTEQDVKQPTDEPTDERGAHGDGRPEDQTPGTSPADAEKDPSTWVTGGEPATGPQRSYLQTLSQEAGEQVPEDISKADASQEIDRLQDKTGRG
ncbi:DUF3072 domain-containing protein [Pseudokineococcus sp. 1T1Z-3]|uniref:DUF3072 domain-containing protein n=1 Tax=Pseudokineococcus sp. 1T1Z-3 TaxID=3132745 RepID=UPI0030A635C1